MAVLRPMLTRKSCDRVFTISVWAPKPVPSRSSQQAFIPAYISRAPGHIPSPRRPMASHNHLFELFESSKSLSTRKIHIHRLYDLLQLSLQRKDFIRARKAWVILSRCPEMNWMAMWRTSLHLLTELDDDPSTAAASSDQIRFLRTMMLEYPKEVRHILKWKQSFKLSAVERKHIHRTRCSVDCFETIRASNPGTRIVSRIRWMHSQKSSPSTLY